MKKYRNPKNIAGISLIEVVVVSAIMLIVFGALLSSFDYSLKIISQSRAKLSAISLANDRMEYFRSLPYNDVGTLANIPYGIIPQNSTTTLNGIEFVERVLVEYVDDPGDGTELLDNNGITSDYKRIRLEYKWNLLNQESMIFVVSNIVPPSIETNIGGGSIRINVLGVDNLPLQGARVRIINSLFSPAIDTTRISDVSGTVLFSGAPAGSNYELIVSGPIGGKNYSTTGTVSPSLVPIPTLSPFAVSEAGVSSQTFFIGALSDLNLRVFTAVNEGEFEDDFTSLTIASGTDVGVSGGRLVLESAAGVYDPSGAAFLGPITPASLESWKTLRIAASAPTGTSYRVRFYTSSIPSFYDLISDANLPGNSSGFTNSLVDISSLDISFSEVFLGITLDTSNTNLTPMIEEVAVYYKESETPYSGQSFTVHGSKILGTYTNLVPVHKFTATRITDVNGESNFTDLEYDDYIFTFPGQTIASACSGDPFVHQADIDSDVEYIVNSESINSLRVAVKDSLGRPIPGASVRLQRSGYNIEQKTDTCGNVYFDSLVDATDFEINIIVAGYTSINVTNVSSSGGVFASYNLTQ